MTRSATTTATRRADHAEAANFQRYLNTRALAEAAVEAERRADASLRLELALAQGR